MDGVLWYGEHIVSWGKGEKAGVWSGGGPYWLFNSLMGAGTKVDMPGLDFRGGE